MKHIKINELKQTEWKNKQGLTAEIDIFPEKSHFLTDHFLWRLSSATIKQNSTFSKYNNYDRLLVVTKGNHIYLNQFQINRLNVFRFKGEAEINCHINESHVVDLGLIFDRDLVQATMSVKKSKKKVQTYKVKDGVSFIFCVTGKLQIDSIVLNPNELLKIDSSCELKLSYLEQTEAVFINVYEIKSKPDFCKMNL